METTKETKKDKKTPPPQELLKKEQTTALSAIPQDLEGAWGAEEASGEDILVPKLLLMHGQSKLVQRGEKNIGDLVRSTTGETLASRKEKVLVIPFQMWKSWRVSEMVGDKNGVQAQWRREEPWTAKNTDDAWEFTEDGKDMRRDRSYNFYGLLIKDLESGEAFPIRLSFVRTSKKAGNTIADFFAKCKATKTPPATQVWEVGSDLIEGKDNSYLTFTAKIARKTEMGELRQARFWYDQLSAKKDHVKHDEDNDDLGTVSAKANPNAEDADY